MIDAEEFLDYLALVGPETVDLEGKHAVVRFGKSRARPDEAETVHGLIYHYGLVNEDLDRSGYYMMIDTHGSGPELKLTVGKSDIQPGTDRRRIIRAWLMTEGDSSADGIVHEIDIKDTEREVVRHARR